MNFQQAINDPDFKGLPLEEQRKVLSRLDKDFSAMFPAEQDKVLNRINVAHQGAITQGKPAWTEATQTGSELGGLALGGILGGAVPGGEIPGAALGYSAGRQAHDRFLEVMGYKKPETPIEAGIKAGVDIPVGGAIQAFGGIAEKGLSTGLRKLWSKAPLAAKGVGPEATQLESLAQSEGVATMAPDITGNIGQAKLFAGLNMLPTSSTVMQKDAAKSINSYARYGSRLKGELTQGVHASPYETGRIVAEGQSVAEKEVMDMVDNLYEIARQKAANVEITFKNFAQKSNEIQNSKRYKLLPNDIKKSIDDFIESFAEGKSVYDDVEYFRRDLAERAINYQGKDRPAAKILFDLERALEKDMEAGAQRVGSDAHKAFLNARDFSAQNAYGIHRGKTEQHKMAIGERIKRSTPEQIMAMAKSRTGLEELKSVLPQEYYQEMKEGLIAEMFENAMKESKIFNRQVHYPDPNKLDRILTSYNKEYLRTLLTPDEMAAIQDYIKLGQSLNTADKIAGNPSGTSGTWYMGQLLTGAGMGAIASGGTTEERLSGAVKGGAMFLGGPFVIAKLITSPIGRQYMTKGFVFESPKWKEFSKAGWIGAGQQMRKLFEGIEQLP